MSALFPYFPRSSQQLCTWLITAPQDHVVLLRFSHFQLEVSDFCESDHVIVRDGDTSTSPVIAKLCGISQKCPLSSSDRYMWIQYSTAHSGMSNAFRATYMAVSQGNKNSSEMIHFKSKLF